MEHSGYISVALDTRTPAFSGAGRHIEMGRLLDEAASFVATTRDPQQLGRSLRDALGTVVGGAMYTRLPPRPANEPDGVLRAVVRLVEGHSETHEVAATLRQIATRLRGDRVERFVVRGTDGRLIARVELNEAESAAEVG